jgi:hypothetical protein
MGQGWRKCKTCGETGVVTQFTKGIVDRRPAEAKIETNPPVEVKMPKRVNWAKHGPFPGTEAPAGLPNSVLAQLEAELKKQPDGELLRKIEIGLFPIVSVAYSRSGDASVAYLVGADRTVQARGVRELRVNRKVIIGLVLFLIAIAIVVGVALALP